jgi:cytochrome c peroxidase
MKKSPLLYTTLFINLAIISLPFLFGNATNTNNTIAKKAAFGKVLFFSNALSLNNTKSCSSCHDPQFAFTDGYKKSIGIDGYNVKRNAPGLQNISTYPCYTWADSNIKQLQQQIQMPLFNHLPNELGWYSNEANMLQRIANIYSKNIQSIYKKNTISLAEMIDCIVAYERTLISYESNYDKYLRGDSNALSTDAKKGMQLFFSKKLQCGYCHSSKNFGALSTNSFYNTGLYNVADSSNYPTADQGLYNITHDAADKGKFRVPSLRNVGITAPYTHDGSVATLSEMIDIYSNGGRKLTSGPYKGNGCNNAFKSPLIKGFTITPEEKIQLIYFLESLTDSSFIDTHKQKV